MHLRPEYQLHITAQMVRGNYTVFLRQVIRCLSHSNGLKATKRAWFVRCVEVADGDGKHDPESRRDRPTCPTDVCLFRSRTQQLTQVQRLCASCQQQDGHVVGRLSRLERYDSDTASIVSKDARQTLTLLLQQLRSFLVTFTAFFTGNKLKLKLIVYRNFDLLFSDSSNIRVTFCLSTETARAVNSITFYLVRVCTVLTVHSIYRHQLRGTICLHIFVVAPLCHSFYLNSSQVSPFHHLFPSSVIPSHIVHIPCSGLMPAIQHLLF